MPECSAAQPTACVATLLTAFRATAVPLSCRKQRQPEDTSSGSSVLGMLLVAGAAAAGWWWWRRRQGGEGDKTGSRSSFKFPAVLQQQQSSGSLPRNKGATNKKNKARRKEEKARRAEKRDK